MSLFFPLIFSAFSALAHDISAKETYVSGVVMIDVTRLNASKRLPASTAIKPHKKGRVRFHPPAGGFDSTPHYPPSSGFHALQNNWG